MGAVVTVGVVGVGALGIHHARIWKELEATGKVVLAGVFDIHPERAAAAARRFQTQTFHSLEELADRCEAASIVTPTSTHFEVGSFLLQKGLHVLIEKPLTTDHHLAEQLVKLAAAQDRILQVGHIERFNPVYRYLRETASDPRFIEVHRLSPYPHRSTDIGVILDLMIHDLDLVLSFVPHPLVSAEAVGVAVLSDSEDIANARLHFANGCVANLTASRVSPERMRKIRVFSGAPHPCYISLDYKAQSGYIYRLAPDTTPESSLLHKLLRGRSSAVIGSFAGKKIVREPVPIAREEPLRLELEHFLDCILAHRKPEVSGETATRVLQLALDLTHQVRSRSDWHLDSPSGDPSHPRL